MERACLEERDRLIVRTLGDTGVRASELLGIRLRNLEEHSHDREYYISVIGKGDKQRLVPVDSKLFKRLVDYAQREGRGREDYLFMAKRRRPDGKLEVLTRSGLNQLITHLARTAKLSTDSGGRHERVFPHMFRHSYITNQLLKGTPPGVVQRIVGHESSALVLEIYNEIEAKDAYKQAIAALK